MAEMGKVRGMGWLPDYPDARDYTPEHVLVKAMVRRVGLSSGSGRQVLPVSVDLRPWCPPIEDQETLGSCTSHAGVGAVEYFQLRAFGKHVDASRLFLYKTTRNLLRQSGDTGAFLRTTMAALVFFGVPPEEYWPYKTSGFDAEPPAFCYAFAQAYQTIQYLRLDSPGTAPADLLKIIKSYIAAGIPPIFGFTVYSSISRSAGNGRIPFPQVGEKVLGGHAVAAAGYDDKMKAPAADSSGCFLVRNSWGGEWGEKGYGWLPYDYVLRGLAEDWWCLLKAEWIDTGEFKL
ncbi:MAG: C1 family peptidase [Candidatus Omnitrophota bacterium]